MDYKVLIEVHVYGEEKLKDQVLIPHNKNYGFTGKEIIAPLRKINGHEICIRGVPDDFSVQQLWNWTLLKIYANQLNDECIKNISDNRFYSSLEKYLVFDGLRYTVEGNSRSLNYYLQLMGVSVSEEINVQLLVCEDEGDFCIDDGIRYYFESHESGKHHCPHVHVDINHECSGSFSIITGEELAGNIIRGEHLKKIKNTILNRQRELLEFWNKYTDGLKVDINQFLGIIKY